MLQKSREHIEKSIIASILVDGSSILKVKDMIKSKYFRNDKLKKLYENMLQMTINGEHIDFVSVKYESRAELAEIVSLVPTSSHIITYAKQLIKLYGIEQLFNLQEKYKKKMEDEDDIIEDYKKELEEIESEVAFELNLDEFKISNLVNLVDTSRSKRVNGKIEGFKTGLPTLDKILRGQLKGKFIVVAGYNSFGKSTLGINMLVNACQDKAKALFFSCEMGREETTARILACIGDVEIYNFIYPSNLNIGEIYDKASKLDLSVIDTVDDIDKMCSIIKNLSDKNKLDIVYIDYLQNLSSNQYPDRTKMLEYASKKLRILALQENICIVALSQLNEESVKGKSFSSGIKGSGDVSSASDVTIKILREKNNDDTFTDWFGVQVFKSRYSELGTVKCKINPKHSKIYEIYDK